MKNWDVIVVGLGPSGSTAARYLAQAGYSVLGFDRAMFPRSKPCAAGLTRRACEALGDLPQNIVERILSKASISLGPGECIEYDFHETVMVTSQRNTLDSYLLQTAAEAGVSIRQNDRIHSIDILHDKCVVRDPYSSFTSRWVLGCDGVNGITSRYVGFKKAKSFMFAQESEIRVDDQIFERLNDKFNIDMHAIPGGYAWCFPKSDHLSIGLCGRFNTKAELDSRLQSYVQNTLSISKFQFLEKTSYPIPVYNPNRLLHLGNLLLCGDSAGLADPFIGEGIYYAVISGQLAAQSIIASGRDGRLSAPVEYQKALQTSISGNLKLAKRLAFWVYLMPGFFYRSAHRHPDVFLQFSSCLKDQNGYKTFINKLPLMYRLLFI